MVDSGFLPRRAKLEECSSHSISSLQSWDLYSDRFKDNSEDLLSYRGSVKNWKVFSLLYFCYVVGWEGCCTQQWEPSVSWIKSLYSLQMIPLTPVCEPELGNQKMWSRGFHTSDARAGAVEIYGKFLDQNVYTWQASATTLLDSSSFFLHFSHPLPSPPCSHQTLTLRDHGWG